MPLLSNPIRIQEYGVGIFISAFTKSALKKALKKKYITVNEVIASTATFIKSGDQIRLSIPKEANSKNKLIFPLKVIFEDEHLAVIHKPAGILVSGNSFKTIANALEQNIKFSTLPDAVKAQPVHRLDYPTTGILMIGKTSSSIRALNKMFEDKNIEKSYYAIAIGKLNNEGTIDMPIDNKKAQSNYIKLQSVPSKRFGELNLVKLNPQTGRRHQLRRHLADHGNPILGDQKYGIDHLILYGKGMYLHAYSLKFIHPFTNERMILKDESLERFNKIFNPK